MELYDLCLDKDIEKVRNFIIGKTWEPCLHAIVGI